jgi:hypothetical protein
VSFGALEAATHRRFKTAWESGSFFDPVQLAISTASAVASCGGLASCRLLRRVSGADRRIGRSWRRRIIVGTRVGAISQAIVLAGDCHQFRMVQEPVKDRRGARHVAEQLARSSGRLPVQMAQ